MSDLDNEELEATRKLNGIDKEDKIEVGEEKKELLTEEEREFLKDMIKFSDDFIITKYIMTNRSNNIYFLNESCQEMNRFKLYNDKYFNKLIFDKEYTLKELGLEE